MKMDFETWINCENKKEEAERVLAFTRWSTGFNEIERILINSINTDKEVAGEWIDRETGKSVYIPTLFEAIYFFNIGFLYLKNSMAGTDPEGRVFFGEDLLNKKEQIQNILETEIKYGICANNIKTIEKDTNKKGLVLF